MASAAAPLGLAQNGIWLFPQVAGSLRSQPNLLRRPHNGLSPQAPPPPPPAPRGPRQASQPALGCRALPRETRRESWLIMSSLTSQLSRGPSFYQMSQGPNAGQGLMDVRNWLLAVAPACPPGVPETSLSPGAHSQSPCLYCITPALVAPHCLARGCLGQIENYPDHSDPRAGRRFLRWDTGPRQWKCESSHSENAYTVWARIDTSRN